LYLTVARPPMYRVDGKIEARGEHLFKPDDLRELAHGMLNEKQRGEFVQALEMNMAMSLPGIARFRVNMFQQRGSVGMVIRRIKADVMSLAEMGLPSILQDIVMTKRGLVLVVGATGSGKSTSLAAMIDHRNANEAGHIITIEDPIEFVHPSKKCLVTQRQVGLHTRSFKHALRAALREDPDIILVGEMRDLETVSIAIETAETGHLVFGTLHTTTAASTIDRIIDQFPPDRQAQVRVMLSESLRGVIAQTLCKKIGGGRVAAREVLLTIPAVSNLIREGKTFQIPSIMQVNRKGGMVTLNDALMELVDAKLVEPKEAYMKSVEKAGFAAALKAKRHDVSFLGEA
jgi:twitching motility protein PilT